jgi:hypothetical protein
MTDSFTVTVSIRASFLNICTNSLSPLRTILGDSIPSNGSSNHSLLAATPLIRISEKQYRPNGVTHQYLVTVLHDIHESYGGEAP